MSHTKKILVAPLNWGLGHATRCIPFIRELQRQGAEIILASDGRALDLLKNEFPNLTAIEMPPYGITYRTGSMVWNMAGLLPKILWAVWREYRLAQKLMTQLRLDGIISDNRYGCFAKKIPCVFLTHQLNIRTPSPVLSRLVNFFNRHFFEKFDACWVPDVPGEPNLSGELSHSVFQEKVRYVGALSRMRFFETAKKYDAIAVLSGPEPQRTYLEQAIVEQAALLPHRFLIVQGKPGQQERFFIEKNVEVVSFLASAELNEAILSSRFFIGRSGYSTIMDLARLGIPALLIPTPGQTEQEYLAEKFKEEGVFLSQNQDELDMEKALTELPGFPGLRGDFFNEELMENAVRDFLSVA